MSRFSIHFPVLGPRVRSGALRWKGSWWQILQCGLGAAVAWHLARALWDQPAPVFAAVAAVISLGVTDGQRLRRVGELGVGVTVGVLLGSLIVQWIGHGGWQIGLIVVLGMAVARFLDAGNLIVNQTALQAVFVLALPPQPGGNSARWLDAMTGAVVALLIAALLPSDPRRELRARTASYVERLAAVLDDTARAVREHDAALAARALEAVRGTQAELDAWAESVTAGQEVNRISPLRWGGREEVSAQERLEAGVDRATRNLRVAVRRVRTALEFGEQMPDSLAGVFEELAAVVRTLGAPAWEGETQPPVVSGLKELAVRLGPRTLGADGLSATVVVAQVRSAVADLLEAHGIPLEEARRLMPR
ncbi:uncharacterized membrane protein YgaE (UPF0421/DUF939 family) [Kineococcus xinjiangensis]|uniref:Uncharacterized membrane protein YgaE (UPF0421/DUF939 family) n=1 Tax=Kineococcus xinjiangensis TaxID=512762 RepID=A0A2S6IUF7_9ACTN|nr:FUSC family protein [Kineococcus xinjiangensis]PPK97905.1 uncharacterized membrane protein YgaE (UPF0421/DUF939 family) [Kineococcus xinjiangensis]